MQVPIRALKRLLWKIPPIQTIHGMREARRVAEEFALAPPDKTPILVYQMAKVGSQTVVRTLESIGLGRPVHHIHYLTAAGTRYGFTRHLRARRKIPYNLLLGRALGEKIRQSEGPETTIITLVRDPIARELSAVFQVPFFIDGSLRTDAGFDSGRVLECLAGRLRRDGACRGAEEWFHEELKEMFDIDVLAAPFSRHSGYAIYRSRSARVLLLRMEDLDRVLGPALADFLNLPEPPKVVRANERKATVDGEAYQRVLDQFRLPRAVVDEIYSGRFVRHFYPTELIDQFTERWTRPIS
jgi:hypothetical protein